MSSRKSLVSLSFSFSTWEAGDIPSVLTFQKGYENGGETDLVLPWPWDRGSVAGKERAPWAPHGLASVALTCSARILSRCPPPECPGPLRATSVPPTTVCCKVRREHPGLGLHTDARPGRTIFLCGNSAQVRAWGTGNWGRLSQISGHRAKRVPVRVAAVRVAPSSGRALRLSGSACSLVSLRIAKPGRSGHYRIRFTGVQIEKRRG